MSQYGQTATPTPDMSTVDPSQTIDQNVGSSSDGGASWLSSVLGSTAQVGTAVIAGQNQAAAYRSQLSLAQVGAQVTASKTTMIIVVAVVAIIIVMMTSSSKKGQ